MSGLKNREVAEMYRRLHRRGLTTTHLAERIISSRAHVTLLLNGSRPMVTRRGRPCSTWRRIKVVLQEEAPEVLSYMQQSSTWNKE